jgi:hypothetical protein
MLRAALEMLTAAEERQRKQGVSLLLVGLNPGVLQTVGIAAGVSDTLLISAVKARSSWI